MGVGATAGIVSSAFVCSETWMATLGMTGVGSLASEVRDESVCVSSPCEAAAAGFTTPAPPARTARAPTMIMARSARNESKLPPTVRL